MGLQSAFLQGRSLFSWPAAWNLSEQRQDENSTILPCAGTKARGLNSWPRASASPLSFTLARRHNFSLHFNPEAKLSVTNTFRSGFLLTACGLCHGLHLGAPGGQGESGREAAASLLCANRCGLAVKCPCPTRFDIPPHPPGI